MAEWSKAPARLKCSGPRMWAWVQIPLPTKWSKAPARLKCSGPRMWAWVQIPLPTKNARARLKCSGPRMWAWVQIPLLTKFLAFDFQFYSRARLKCSGPRMWAWVQIPLLTKVFSFRLSILFAYEQYYSQNAIANSLISIIGQTCARLKCSGPRMWAWVQIPLLTNVFRI
ncbi:hypothetical protein DPMN_024691 [Dreissena polymorpha]|uniref:Uncharacterized protein n=1 Tax=Dreissena polymorpha TaxID=45954 RepID=A0A9D4LPV2_DREPO|nr:hypothetical protein DPMN_024691 [Dreissena polymorpha]